ncbi:MAG: hypothetical protein Q9175_005516 [Cornicularia normoerica]
MAASHIPNLNTLRNARGTGRGRDRLGPGSLFATASEEDKVAKDKVVQQTDQDASVSRLSAVEAGYLNDPFARHFVSGKGQRRLPIINRGTYVRTTAIDNLVDEFLSKNPAQAKQIISLGAGSDTRFFRLMSRESSPNGTGILQRPNIIYHEIDFKANTTQKLHPIKKLSELYGHIGTPITIFDSGNLSEAHSDDTLHADQYHIHPIDLRNLDPSCPAPRSFDVIDTALPTLIISECCLCYLSPAAADTVALYFTRHLLPDSTPVGLILYEPVQPNDPFGKTMVSNLAARGIVLQTLKRYGSLEAQAARMISYGLGGTGGASVKDLWDKGVEEKEKERVARLEMVDEVEEWELLAGHYCVAWGWRGWLKDDVWEGWKRMAERVGGKP